MKERNQFPDSHLRKSLSTHPHLPHPNELTGEEGSDVLETEDPAELELGGGEGVSQLQVQQRVGRREGL